MAFSLDSKTIEILENIHQSTMVNRSKILRAIILNFGELSQEDQMQIIRESGNDRIKK